MKLNPIPWVTPNYINFDTPPQITPVEGVKQLISIALKDCDVEDLDIMCDMFRQEIFKMSGKPDPKATYHR